MAETKSHEESALHPKRKSDVSIDEALDSPKKNPKIESLDKENQAPLDNLDSVKEAEAGSEEDEGDYGSDDEDGEDSNGEEEEEVDHKGKGITREDKGKGKLIVEEEDEDDDDDDDDSSNGGGSELEDGDSDLSDDPLAEVDLDNILPSRTRRRQVQPGVYIANDKANAEEDDSDDSDA
ncbi:hypothetical protein CsatB_021185 [Cannabis sativa]